MSKIKNKLLVNKLKIIMHLIESLVPDEDISDQDITKIRAIAVRFKKHLNRKRKKIRKEKKAKKNELNPKNTNK